jgi:hypothetical protein
MKKGAGFWYNKKGRGVGRGGGGGVVKKKKDKVVRIKSTLFHFSL